MSLFPCVAVNDALLKRCIHSVRAACQSLFVRKPNPNHKPGFSVAVVVSAGFLKKVYSQRDVGLLNSLRLAG